MRLTIVKVAAVALLAGSIGYLLASLRNGDAAFEQSIESPPGLRPPFLVFRTLAPHHAYGRLATLPLNPGDSERVLTPLSCARVHYARGVGLCIVPEQVGSRTEYAAYTFDRSFVRRNRIALRGVPTRARISPDGRRGSITTYGEEPFETGERLITTSVIIDLAAGRVLADVGDFRIINEAGAPIDGPTDVSSVAFEGDGDRFFATLVTATNRYLVAGSVDERRITTIRSGVASEALSPDGRHLAVKRLLDERGFWQLAVINLSTWTERDLNQGSRSIDDQVEWLDNDHVMYHDVVDETTGIWMLPIDGISGASVFVRDAFSATAQR